MVMYLFYLLCFIIWLFILLFSSIFTVPLSDYTYILQWHYFSVIDQQDSSFILIKDLKVAQMFQSNKQLLLFELPDVTYCSSKSLKFETQRILKVSTNVI